MQSAYRRDIALGVLVAAVATLPGLADKGTEFGWAGPQRPFDLLAGALVAAHCLPLAVRRRAPTLCLIVVSGAFFAYQCRGYRVSSASIALYIALFSAGMHVVRRRPAVVAGWLGGYLLLVLALRGLGSPNTTLQSVEFLALPAGCWLAGAWARARLVEQARLQQLGMELAMRDERERIARDLHDVVTHHVTAMVMQADATRYIPAEDRPKIEAGLTAVGGTGRRALADLRELLGVLSPAHDTHPAPRAPVGGRVSALVEQTRLAGQPVDATVDADLDDLADVTAFRVVQEALTNALRHAPGRPTMVRVEPAAPDQLTIEVTTEGSATPAPTGGGRGLDGLRRRVHLAGGELTAGQSADGGFTVHARLPIRSDTP